VDSERTRSAGLRALAAAVLGLAYVLGMVALLLALIGRGLDATLHVHGLDVVAWFALLMAIGVAAIWVYPYDRPSRPAEPPARTGTPPRTVGARRV